MKIGKIKKWWRNIKYWKKGIIIGGLISIIFMITFSIITYNFSGFYETKFSFINYIGLIIFGIPIMLGLLAKILYPCMDYCPIIYKILYPIIIIIFWSLVGALLGLIIQKLKKR